MNLVPGRASASGHLDPSAQEFTPGPYSLLRAPPAPPPPPPLYYSSYPLDGQSYVQPAASAGSIPVNPVMPMYHTSEVGIPYAPTIPQPWDSRQQHQQEAYRLGIGMQGGAEVVPRPGPPCLPFLPRGMTSYRYHGVNFNGAIQNSNLLVSRLSTHYQQAAAPPFPMGREHASRTLLLSMVPAELSDSDLRQQLEKWGPVRALQTENGHQGYVTVHYYDLRHAKTALMEIQEQHLAEQKRLQQHYHGLQLRHCRPKDEDEQANGEENGIIEEYDQPPPPPPEASRGLIGGKAIWAQYAIPVGLPLGTDGHNQGTLVVFNLDADIDTNALRSIFEAFGAVKELRETPTKRQHKFVEFFDVRDAARALAEMDGQEIGGKRVKIEFSRPGGQTRRRTSPPPPPPPPPPYSSLVHVSQPQPPPCSNTNHQIPILLPHQQQQQPRWSNGGNIDSKWARPESDRAGIGHTSGMNGRGSGGGRGRGGCGSGAGRGNTNSRNTTTSNSGSNNNNNCNGRYKVGNDGFGGGGFVRRRRSNGSHAQGRSEQAVAEANGIGIFSKGPSAKNGSSTNHNHNNNSGRFYSETASHFAFDEAKAEANSSDARTTVMIKNIPNKYSQQMLLSMLDQHCICCNESITDHDNEPSSAYDFVYLPIDFKNKCNLGYAFVNMTTSKATWKLYKAFNKQPWEAFNSRKICEVTYARVQGRAALEEHFRNSKFACDTDEYLPLVFDPPRDGEQITEPLTMGDHISCNKNVVGSSIAQDDRESDAPPPQLATTTPYEPYSDVKSMNACYRNNNNFHRSHDANNFSHGRRQQQQRSMGGGNRVGCA